MNLQIRPKLYPPLALLAAPPARNGRSTFLPATLKTDLRRLVAAMVD